ncbi:GNAT family N-acetyltransferase [Paenibacillus sp. R14(2021)]|uniref:GNAT family N-acetyltransferase n=1 Tax=Paenibacillus sp. R14(2021) TaxID=2859228 RepID=UPI001C616A6E|nr:GNAT family N-acetyltransferase [Paenibacillus sp. R14(2021)]
MYIRVLQPDDTEIYWQLRLKATKENPESFSSSFEELVDTPNLVIQDRLKSSDSQFVMGAFADSGELIGILGFQQELSKKFRHKGVLSGMYVDQGSQGQGVGRQLLSRMIEHIETETEIEQLNLAVAEHNKSAKRLYETFGFTTYGLEINAMKLDEHTFVNGEYMAKQLGRRCVLS